jgi:septation ring formation regulator EzrA
LPHDEPEQSDEVEIDETTHLSPAEVNKMTVTEAQVIPTNTMTRSETYCGNTNANDQSELKTMLASILKEGLKTLQDKLDKLDKLENKLEVIDSKSNERYENSQSKLETSLRELENKLETSFRESNDKFQRDIEIKLEKLQENMKTDLETEIEKLIQRFDLASENQVVEVTNQEKIDVILRRQGECVEQMQLQVNQVSVLDQELQSDVETIDPLENEQTDLADESQEVELSNTGQTDVILWRQGEYANGN